MGREVACSSTLHAPCGLRMLCALLLCAEAIPGLQIKVGHARRAVSAFRSSLPQLGRCICA